MTISFVRHRFLHAIIWHTVWLYVRFTLSHRDVLKFGPTLVKEVACGVVNGLDGGCARHRMHFRRFRSGPIVRTWRSQEAEDLAHCIAGSRAAAKRGGRISRHRGNGSSWRKLKGHPRSALDGREVRRDRLGQARRAEQGGSAGSWAGY
jgi:hypothetical protein